MSDRILEYNFLDGIETSKDKFLATGMEVLENAYFTDRGTPKKRNGFESITMTDTDGNSIGTIVKIETFLESALIFTDRGVYVRAGGVIRKCGDQQAGSLSVNRDFTEARIVSYTPRVSMAQTSSGLKCICLDFVDDGGLNIQRTLFYKNDSLISQSFADGGSVVRKLFPIVINNEIYIINHGANASVVSLQKFTETTATLSTVVASISITDASTTIDVVSDGTTFVVVSQVNTTRIRFTKINTAGAVTQSLESNDSEANAYVNADLINGEIYTYYQAAANKNVKMVVVNYSALTVTNAIQTIWTNPDSNYAVTQVVSGIEGAVVYALIENYYNSENRWKINSIQISASYTPTDYGRYIFQHSISGKVATVNGRIYFPILRGRNSIVEKGSTGFFLMNKEFCFIASAFHGRVWAKDAQTNAIGICGYPSVNGSSIVYPVVTTSKTFSDADDTPAAININTVAVDVLKANTSKGVFYQDCLISAGPIVKAYDSVNLFDYQFTQSPYAVSATEDGAGNLEAGTRQWFFVAKFVDIKGNAHYSPPSRVISLPVDASKKVNIVFESLIAGSHFWGANGVGQTIEIYRTLANGSIFYRLAELEYKSGEVSTTTDINTYVDNIADTTLDDNELYPNQEILDDDFANPCTTLFNYKNRLLMSPSDLTDRVKFSKEKVEGQASMFSEFLFVYNEESGFNEENETTASCVLDDKIVVFKSSSIQITGGEPPNNAGEGSGLVLPQTIEHEVGCINPASVIQISNGVMFQSDRGIYLLNRGMQVIPVGEPISDKTLTITTSYKSKGDDLAFFQTSNNGIAVYDTKLNKWSMFTNYNAAASSFVNGKIIHSTTGNTLFVQNASYSDNGSFIVQKYTTPWIKLGNLQGFFRFKRLMFLGKWVSAHNLKFSFAYDYEDYNWSNDTFVPTNTSDFNRTSAPTQAQLYAGANTGNYQVRMTPLRQKCEAVKITIEDVDTGTDGESFLPTGLSFLVAVKRGQHKLISNKQG